MRVPVLASTIVLALGVTAAVGGNEPPPGPPPGGAATRPDPDAETPREELDIAGATFRLEIAADPVARARGLMEREVIEPDGGMLFIFPDARDRQFWMANCRVDMALIFLDERGVIVATHEMRVEPPRHRTETRAAYERRLRSYRSRRPARYAIELEAGSIRRRGLEIGRTIEMDLRRLERMAR